MAAITDQDVAWVQQVARDWLQTRGILNPELREDLEQEALVAACECGRDSVAIIQAMDRYRKREYRASRFSAPLAACAEDLRADHFQAEAQTRHDDMGRVYDPYHGWCRDDV